MSTIVDNAIIMAAGFASRFVPISYEKPKGLIKVKGEVLIERQIQRLQKARIKEIIVVIGHEKEQFYYLEDEFNVILVENTEYETRNNHSSIYAARQYLKNSYICASDIYFERNIFEKETEDAWYSVGYVQGETDEWCVEFNDKEVITNVTIGGKDSWVLLNTAFFTKKISEIFLSILDTTYDLEETKEKFWETIFFENLNTLEIKAKKYENNVVYEFDFLSELREFDESFNVSSDCKIMQDISQKLNCSEGKIVDIYPLDNNEGMQFEVDGIQYTYIYDTKLLKILERE